MSQFSLNLPSSDTLWYTPSPMDPHHPHHSHHQKPLPLFNHPSSFKYDDFPEDQCETTTTTTTTTTTSSSSTIDHEYMFEKPLTPSDVGKLNRLVIPKQHAEKYFPLSSTTTSAAVTTTTDGTTPGGGGVLLGFEDESGKCWKFRYSYWNSSQSYVLTKGWSRYVKEKKLDAGDVVLFQRHRFENDRFFIGWRRRGSNPVQSNNNSNHNNIHTVPVQNYGAHGFNAAPHQHQINSFSPYRRDSLHATTGTGTEVREKGRKSMGRKVRLFGVNLECQITDQEEEDEQVVAAVEEDEEIMSQTSDGGSSLSSQGHGHGQGQHTPSFSVGPNAYNYFDCVGYSPNKNTHYTNNHMDMNFPQDVNHMRNRLR